jgi:8-oxo-dGTP pyrophosphatase MutT (NUDIX family)
LGACIQYGALPYRLSESGETEVLLITSRTRRRWIIPKGWPIKGVKPQKSAEREAYEEAGVRGKMSTKSLGSYSYEKCLRKTGRSITCEVTVFLLAVEQQLDVWPESTQREVRWFGLAEALTMINEQGLRPLLVAFARRTKTKRQVA